MLRPELISLGGQVDRPGASLRAAMLAAALIMMAVGPILLLSYPRPTHAVKVDLRPGQLADRNFHRVRILRSGAVMLDGIRHPDHVRLRMGLDHLLVAEDELAVELLAHADARYEDVVEVLAVVRRASVPHVRVTTSQ